MLNHLNKWIAPLKRRVLLMVSRAILRAVNDQAPLQQVQISLLADELRDKVEHFQSYGFTSYPHVGAECAVMFVSGNRDHGLVIAIDDRRYRLKPLLAGEVALYTDEGDKIHLQRGRVIRMETNTLHIQATQKIHLDTPMLEVTGDVQDCIGTNKITLQTMRNNYNVHTHSNDGLPQPQMN
jgi:phage baseplate assembly protein V